MKLTKPLRDYIQFRTDKGSNMAAFADALDQIEAYIMALEMHKAKSEYNPYREALAKICVYFFADLYLPKELYMTVSLEDAAKGAVDYPQWTPETADIIDDMQSKFVRERAEWYRALADDLVNVQEVYRYKTGHPVDQKYVDLYNEVQFRRSQAC